MLTKKRIVALTLAAAMTLSLGLTSCKSAGSGSGEKSVVIDIEQEPPKMNSIITSDAVSLNVLRHVSEGLTVLDKEDKPVAGVAEKWDISEDGLTYTFHLRKDYKWSNGDPVTAKDFEFAFKGLVTPSFGAVYASLGNLFKNGQAFYESESYKALDEEGKADYMAKHDGKAPADVTADQIGVKVIDDYTLEIVLERPASYLLDILAFQVLLPVNQKVYEQYGEQYGTEADKMLYNGAYVISEWSHDSQLIMKKNPDYPKKDSIKIDTIKCVMMNDSNTRLNTFQSGEVDMVRLNGEQTKSLEADGKTVQVYDDGSVWYIQYNMQNDLYKNLNLRKALALAIDSKTYVDVVVADKSIVADRYTPPTVNGNKDKFSEEMGKQFDGFNPDEARKYLELAKKELGVTDLKLTLIGGDTDFAQKSLAFFQEMWQKELGIKIEVEGMPFKSRLARMEKGEFEMVMAGWSPDYNDPLTYLDLWESSNGNNYGKYKSEKFDKAIEASRNEADRDKRFGYLMDAEKTLFEDFPLAPYYYRANNFIVSDKVTGIFRTAFQDFNLLYADVK